LSLNFGNILIIRMNPFRSGFCVARSTGNSQNPVLRVHRRLIMKQAITAILFAFIGSAVLPVFAADAPKTPEECKKAHAGDDAKIQECIKALEKK
jgi:hypothetical protein